MPYVRTYDMLRICSLTPEWNQRTCNYWWTITTFGATPHKAFRRLPALLRWLEERGLTVEGDLPPQGEFATFRIAGSYREASYLHDREAFDAIEGLQSRQVDNARYTLTKITSDPDGLRTVHYLNCNVKDRPEFNYWQSEAEFC